MIRGLVLLGAALAAAVVSTGCSRPPVPPGPLRPSDIMAIDQVRTSFVEAELKGDRAAQASLYTSDAVLLEPDAPVFQGRRAIRAGLEEINVVLAGFTLKSLELGGGNSTAYDRGVYRLQYFDSAAGAMAAERGNYLMILRRQREGSWRIVALIHNPLERSLEPGKPSSR